VNPLLTIFSAPKPFTDPHIATIQRNAIQSWLHLGAEVEVLLVGEEEGTAEVAAELGVRLLADVRRNASGTPQVDSIFALARQASRSPNLAYVNADILLLRDVIQATRQVSVELERRHAKGVANPTLYLVIGQRWDLNLSQPWDFSDDWEQRLSMEARRHGQLHAPAGSDYFVFPREAFAEMPDFAIGRAGWDNWMIYHAYHHGWPVIDATPAVMVVHQSHDYSHLPGGLPHYNQAESQQNMRNAGGLAHMYMVLDAPFQLKEGRIRRAPLTRLRMIRSIERWLMPEKDSLRGLRGGLARRFRRMRRGVDWI
jgi:hypothetical protein